jgi:hypothetical protein
MAGYLLIYMRLTKFGKLIGKYKFLLKGLLLISCGQTLKKFKLGHMEVEGQDGFSDTKSSMSLIDIMD